MNIYRLVETSGGARIEKRDEQAYNGYREVAKISIDEEADTRKLLTDFRDMIDRNKEIKQIVEEDKELLEKLG
jgi:hypothetical protein